jgi:hypothetical protein
MTSENVAPPCHGSQMTGWLGYESVYSFQETAFGHWCRMEAMMLAQNVSMRQDMGGGSEWLAEARRLADGKFLSRREVRRLLVAAASGGEREIVSYGYDEHGLVTSVVFYPSRPLGYEPVWVSRKDTSVFKELLEILQRSGLPFDQGEPTLSSPPRGGHGSV